MIKKGTLMLRRARRGPRVPFLLLILVATLLPACDLLGGPQATPTPTPSHLPPATPAAGTPEPGPSSPTPAKGTVPTAAGGNPATPPSSGPATRGTPSSGSAGPPTAIVDTPGGPLLEVAVNGGREAEVPRGWPLLLLVDLTHPDIAAPEAEVTPLPIAAAQGDWSNAIRVTVRNARGGAETWPLHLAQTPSQTLTLDTARQGQLLWYLAPEETARLAEGDYTLRATLDTTASTVPGGWRGHVRAVPVLVHVSAEPATLTAEQEAEKAEVLVAYALWRGDTTQALAHLDARLSRQPADYNALTLKADILVAAGRNEEALALYNQAIDAYLAQNPNAGEQPEGLLVKRGLLQEKVYKLRRP